MVGFNLFQFSVLEGQNMLERLGEEDFEGSVAILAVRLTVPFICGRFLLSPKIVSWVSPCNFSFQNYVHIIVSFFVGKQLLDSSV